MPMGDEFNGLNAMDRDALMVRMAKELPELRKKLNVSVESLGAKTGIDENKIRQAEAGESIFKWSEYMSILFIFWNNDVGRSLIEARGLFPNALKRAMSVNRNAHEPVTEASRFGL